MNSTKNREEFLKALQYFNENYKVITGGDTGTNRRLDKLNKGDEHMREVMPYGKIYSHIDVKQVRRVTINHENNCFKPFYAKEAKLQEFKEYDGRWLYVLFGVLSDTKIGLLYVDDYAENYKDRIIQNRNQALQKKIDDILDYANSVHTNKATTKGLDSLRGSLDNIHLTKHEVFKNLLYWVGVLLNNGKNSHVVANTTNAIIEDYFEIEDIQFSRFAKIENYTKTTYYYSDAKGLEIYHS